jgi:hypothetical protein
MRVGVPYYQPGQVLFIRDSIYIVISDSKWFIECYNVNEEYVSKLSKMYHETLQEKILKKYCK